MIMLLTPKACELVLRNERNIDVTISETAHANANANAMAALMAMRETKRIPNLMIG
jgi:hypothetical protein